MKNKSKDKKVQQFIYILICLLIILSGLLFWLRKESFLNCVNINFRMCLSSKKYISKESLFSFRYPADFPIATANEAYLNGSNGFYALEGAPKKVLFEIINFSKEFYENAGGDRLAYIRVERNKLTNVDDYIKEQEDSYNNLPTRYKNQQNKPIFTHLTISGQEAIRFSIGQSASTFVTPETRYILFHNGYMYTLSFYYDDYYHKLPVEYYDQARRLILSTFKFNK